MAPYFLNKNFSNSYDSKPRVVVKGFFFTCPEYAPPNRYSIIHLSEIMRLSAFPTPLYYPSSYSILGFSMGMARQT
jgi:hypothetical protein